MFHSLTSGCACANNSHVGTEKYKKEIKNTAT
jgi:hypothetical protein